MCLLAVLAGAECFTEIALFGVKKLDFLRPFRPFKDGTPDHGHLGDILAVLDAEQFQRCFVAWVAAMSGIPGGVIAIDGKTVRRSAQKRTARRQSTWFPPSQLVNGCPLGQVKVAEKSNEIIVRGSPEFGQRVKLGLLLIRTDLHDEQTETVFGGFQSKGGS